MHHIERQTITKQSFVTILQHVKLEKFGNTPCIITGDFNINALHIENENTKPCLNNNIQYAPYDVLDH